MQLAETVPLKPRAPGFSRAGLTLAILGALLALCSGPGHRLNGWSLATGITLLRTGIYFEMAAALLSFAGILQSRNTHTYGRVTGTIGLVIALAIISYPGSLLRTARHAPLHAVTTDAINPPQFDRSLHKRGSALAPPSPERERDALQQRLYPDIQSLHLALPENVAFPVALRVARDAGWHIIAADQQPGRIMASHTSFWFGVTTDIVVRLSAEKSGTRIDVRATTRQGDSDFGANARAIRHYLKTLRASAP